MTIKEREDAYDRIALAIIRNYDEVTEHDEPYISLLLSDEIEFPKCYEQTDESEFVDELWGLLDEIKQGYGVYLCISKSEPDGYCERVDEIELENLDDKYLTKLLEIVENHQGSHIGSKNLNR